MRRMRKLKENNRDYIIKKAHEMVNNRDDVLYAFVGVRFQGYPIPKIGERLPDTMETVDGEPTGEFLDGASVVGVIEDEEVLVNPDLWYKKGIDYREGRDGEVIIVGGDRRILGDDDEEFIIRDPIRIA